MMIRRGALAVVFMIAWAVMVATIHEVVRWPDWMTYVLGAPSGFIVVTVYLRVATWDLRDYREGRSGRG